MSGLVRVWCLRHAEAEKATTAPAGADPAPPLTAQGRLQAVAAAQALAGEPITRIYSSTMLRARQTAELLAIALGIEVAVMPELVEVSVSEHVLRAWIVDRALDVRAAGGESGFEVVARVTAALQKIARTHPDETVAVVGHVASLTVALGSLCRLGDQVWGTPLPHAHPFLVEWDGRAWHCPAWPATAGPS